MFPTAPPRGGCSKCVEKTQRPALGVDPNQRLTLAGSFSQSDSETNGASSATTLSSPPGGITEAQLCALAGARFNGKSDGTKTLTVDVGSDAH